MKKILSIDGGGIRGIIPALVLAEIEKRTGKPAAKLFDLVAGTSTGGILALGLLVPNNSGGPKYGAADLARLYEQEGERIFSRSVWHAMRSLGIVGEEKYPAQGIENVLEDYFGDCRLKDVLTDVIVTSYEIELRIPWFFKSRHAKNPERSAEYDFPIKQVLRATSAAPTYFEPSRIHTETGADYWAFVDGAVYANNPAMCAYVEARDIYPDDEVLLVSLGTGSLSRPLHYDRAKTWGLTGWARQILNVTYDGVSDTVDYQLRKLLPANCYHRFQIRLDNDQDELDNAELENIRGLQILAKGLIQNESRRLDTLCALLV